MKKKTFITVLAVVLGLFSAQTVSAGWVSDTLKKIENGEISPGVIRPADPTNTPTPAPVEEETASSSKFSFSFCVDSNEDIAEVEPAIVVNAPDGKAYAWTSSDVVNDDAIRYFVCTDMTDNTTYYEAEVYSVKSFGKLCMLELNVAPEDIKEQDKVFEMYLAYSDETTECYFYDKDYLEHKLTLQLNGATEIDGFYFANYSVIDKDELEKINSFEGPGVMFNMQGNFVGILCEEALEEHDIMLFAEPVD